MWIHILPRVSLALSWPPNRNIKDPSLLKKFTWERKRTRRRRKRENPKAQKKIVYNKNNYGVNI